MMRGSNMGIMPYWFIILLITWGLGRIRTTVTPLDRLKATSIRGQRECCKTTAQTQAPTEHSSNVAWGFFAVEMNKESTLVIGYQAMAWKPSVYT